MVGHVGRDGQGPSSGAFHVLDGAVQAQFAPGQQTYPVALGTELACHRPPDATTGPGYHHDPTCHRLYLPWIMPSGSVRRRLV